MNSSVTAHWVALSYDRIAEDYENRFRDLQYVKFHAMLYLAEVRQRLCRSVLDLGCGTGLAWRYVQEELKLHSRELAGWIGVDLSERMLNKARSRGMQVIQADMACLPFQDASYPLVVAFTSMALAPGNEIAEINEVLRILSHDGIWVATVLVKTEAEFRKALRETPVDIVDVIPCGQDTGFVLKHR